MIDLTYFPHIFVAFRLDVANDAFGNFAKIEITIASDSTSTAKSVITGARNTPLIPNEPMPGRRYTYGTKNRICLSNISAAAFPALPRD